jgi:hypothetical protein
MHEQFAMKRLATALLLTAALVTGCSAANPEPAAVQHRLLADEPWYRANPQPERAFEGTLVENRAPRDKHYFRRSNRYLLQGSETWQVYSPSRDEALAPFAGTHVRLIGKLVETDVEGIRRREIWPARLEAISATVARDGVAAGGPTRRSPGAGTTPATRRGS